MKTNFINKIKVFVVFALFIGTFLIPVNIVASSSNPNSTDINQETQNEGTQEIEYWALIVAVGVYADDPQQNRPLMLLEADDFYNEILKSEIWTEDHIKVIKAEDATVLNIISGFRWLDRMEDENDISVVYLTTHGGPIGFDLPPFDEEDKNDEILSSYWSFAYPKLGIWDDEVNILLNQLESEGVCLIVDSCYAGGFNDPPDWNRTSRNIFSFLEKQNTMSSQDWMKGFAEEISGQNRVVLMASSEDEMSYSGGFAPYLIDGLRGYADNNSDGIVTAEEAFFYSQPRTYRQHPTIYDGYPGELPLVYLNEEIKDTEIEQKIPEEKNIGINTYFEYDAENSIIKGFVKDADTNDTIEGAHVYVSGRDYNWEFFENETTTGYNGFYIINVPPCRCRIIVSADEYCGRQSSLLEIEENETLWVNFSLYPRPLENSVVCGYIKDNNTGNPINGANISLLWEGSFNQFYINNTISDYLGFYQMNVAEGSITLEVEASGYFQEYVEEIAISDFETLWFNFSLISSPPENSVLCGYITDKETGSPINNARVTIEWVDASLNHEYRNQTYTNSTGFYSINLASGELYLDISKMGYEYYDPYRHDADENSTLWYNVSIGQQTIEVDFLKPLRAFYINNKRLMPYYKTRIIGSIDIEIYSHEDWYGHSEVDRVEFYIDGKLKAEKDSEPFVWTWDEKKIGKHTIKVVAFDYEGNSDSKEIVVYKLL